MGEGFLAPEGSAEREAYWGAVIGTWTTPGGGECFEFESGAKLCDHPDGSTFVWIVEDYTAWMQDSDGGKEWLSSDSGSRPPGPPDGGSSGGGEEPPDIYTMITEAANGERVLSGEELTTIAEYVEEAGFDPTYQAQAGPRLDGLTWKGDPVYADTLLSPADSHYLLHVIRNGEWPEETTQEEYEQSIRGIVDDPNTGIMVSWYRDQGWQLSFARRSGALQGPRGYEWVVVEYNLYYDNWTTAFQPLRGLAYLEEPDREDAKWLRNPR